MPPPLIGGALSNAFVWRLSVCLSRTSGLSREQRGLGRPKLAQRQPTSHVTRKPKGPGRQAALLSAALTHKAAAAVYTLLLLGGARGAWAPTGGEGRGHIVSPRAQLVLVGCESLLLCYWRVALTEAVICLRGIVGRRKTKPLIRCWIKWLALSVR